MKKRQDEQAAAMSERQRLANEVPRANRVTFTNGSPAAGFPVWFCGFWRTQ